MGPVSWCDGEPSETGPIMAKTKSRHSRIWDDPPPAPARRPAPPDLSVLGSGVKHLPPPFWEPRMFFQGAFDVALREATGVFPATFRPDRKTHPLFVLDRIGDLGHRVCPCSSRNRAARRFIREGCVLEITQRITDSNIYLVESCTFNLPLDPEFWEPLLFMGRVPEVCLMGCAP
jgi:hypothetical protein